MTLKSYKYSPLINNEEEKSNEDIDKPDPENIEIEDTPGLEIIVFLNALMIYLFYKKRKIIRKGK